MLSAKRAWLQERRVGSQAKVVRTSAERAIEEAAHDEVSTTSAAAGGVALAEQAQNRPRDQETTRAPQLTLWLGASLV